MSPSSTHRGKPIARLEVRIAWFLCAVGAIALLADAAIGRRTGIRDAYRLAVERAEKHPAVTAALGTPLTSHWMPELAVDKGPGYHRVSMAIRLVGSDRIGVLRVRAGRDRGTWQLDELQLEVEGRGGSLELLR